MNVSNERAVIGANMPPEPIDALATMTVHIEDLYELAESALTGAAIDTAEKAEQIAALKSEIKKAASDADKARKADKEPHLIASRDVDARWKPIIDKATLAARTAAEALTPWLQKVQAEKDAAQQRLRDAAKEQEEAARQAFLSTPSTDLEARAEAERLAEEAKKAKAQANKIDRSATGLRTYWSAEVTSYGSLLAYMKKNDPDALRALLDQYVQQQKNAGVRILPGVVFKEEKRAV